MRVWISKLIVACPQTKCCYVTRIVADYCVHSIGFTLYCDFIVGHIQKPVHKENVAIFLR